ncbi:MAG: GNAT family N-acetyltransferase [Armatimonadetes bacterium]|nr:GNAT family N-acetyltransferase [Armatimonadota bacterium]
MPEPSIRPFAPADQDGVRAVIETVFQEYGFTWEPDGYNLDCVQVARHYILERGGFWVMEFDGRIIGTTGLKTLTEERCELCRMYLLAQYRGRGWGRRLFARTVQEAQRIGYREMEIWSDKKLREAHRLYSKSGARPIGDRICNDPDQAEEWGFLLDVRAFLKATRGSRKP